MILPLSAHICSRKTPPMLLPPFLSSFQDPTFPRLKLSVHSLKPALLRQRKNNGKSYKVTILQHTPYLCLDNKQAPLEDSDRHKKCTKNQTWFPSFTWKADSQTMKTTPQWHLGKTGGHLAQITFFWKYRADFQLLTDHFFFFLLGCVMCDNGPCRMNSLPRFYGQKGRNPICDNHIDFFLITASACISPTCRKEVSTNHTAAESRTGAKSNIWTSLWIKV